MAALSLGLAACGSDEADSTPTDGAASDASNGGSADEPAGSGELPTIVVTTNVLGDVVQQVVGDAAQVVTIMPVGADPHDFQASAQEVAALNGADALIVNGAGFEEGLLDVIEGAEDEGVPTFEAISSVETIEFGEGGHGHDDEHSDDEHKDEHDDEEHSDDEHGEEEHSDDEHGDEEHSDENHSDDEHDDEKHSDDEHKDEDEDEHPDDDHGDEEHSDDEHDDEGHSDEEHSDDEHDEHGHSGADPHFFTDPVRMADAVAGMVDFLQETVEFADPAAVDASAAAYIDELNELNDAVAGLVASIPDDRRVLVTNHEVFGYFADRYGFEVVGAVVPGGSTTDSASAGELAELAEVVEAEGVPAIFADTSSSDDLVEALATEVGDIAVVELYSESLGESGSDGATYLDMVLTNAKRMSEALA